eukprot:TRINITY_DN355_c0_g1_i1.p1 TRINITY_DN355_c0_g1~~TRINITY_DN355_c0_g1_i1.p1  ORF type:complete len:826 (+),score=302.67 TRINITY_DN355_c0_g1_i1:83-2560(+)
MSTRDDSASPSSLVQVLEVAEGLIQRFDNTEIFGRYQAIRDKILQRSLKEAGLPSTQDRSPLFVQTTSPSHPVDQIESSPVDDLVDFPSFEEEDFRGNDEEREEKLVEKEKKRDRFSEESGNIRLSPSHRIIETGVNDDDREEEEEEEEDQEEESYFDELKQDDLEDASGDGEIEPELRPIDSTFDPHTEEEDSFKKEFPSELETDSPVYTRRQSQRHISSDTEKGRETATSYSLKKDVELEEMLRSSYSPERRERRGYDASSSVYRWPALSAGGMRASTRNYGVPPARHTRFDMDERPTAYSSTPFAGVARGMGEEDVLRRGKSETLHQSFVKPSRDPYDRLMMTERGGRDGGHGLMGRSRLDIRNPLGHTDRVIPRTQYEQEQSKVDTLQSLVSENSLLRSELISVSEYSKDLRHEIEQLKTERESDIDQAKLQATRKQVDEVSRLQKELSVVATELERCERSKKKVEERLSSFESAMMSRESENVDAMREFQFAAGMINELAEGITQYSRVLLPTFHPEEDDDGEEEMELPRASSIEIAARDAHKAFQNLKRVVSARMETYDIMRQKLKKENDDLKTKLESSVSRTMSATSHHQKEQSRYREEREQIQREIREMEMLYEKRITELQSTLSSRASRDTEAVGTVSQLEKELEDVSRALEQSTKEKKSLELRLDEDHAARAQLAGDLSEERRKVRMMEEELETLKLTQKFLPRTGDGRATVDQMELMRRMDQLLSENRALKEEKAALEGNVHALKKENLEARLQASISDREVLMAARDEVSSHELTSKLFQRHRITGSYVPSGASDAHHLGGSTAVAQARSGMR